MNSRTLFIVGFVCLLGGAYAATQTFTGSSIGSDATNTAQDTDVGEDASGAAAATELGTQSGPEQQLAKVERMVPTFELRALDGTPWTRELLKGRPWVINFWASWCPPCIEEIPSMNAAFDVLEPQGIGMLAINAGEGAELVEEFLEKVSIDFPSVVGDANTLPNWSIKALPTTIVVDAEGVVVYEALGPREWDDERLLKQVVDLL
ncbi:MAG: TlpA family protein disulfide reductase [Granulosicoccus sp.]